MFFLAGTEKKMHFNCNSTSVQLGARVPTWYQFILYKMSFLMKISDEKEGGGPSTRGRCSAKFAKAPDWPQGACTFSSHCKCESEQQSPVIQKPSICRFSKTVKVLVLMKVKGQTITEPQPCCEGPDPLATRY